MAVKNLGDGRIEVERKGRSATIDMTREIAGCKRNLYDPSTREEYESSVRLEIVDETEKAPYTYLVLLAAAPPNCNVQGHCGAGDPDITLLWLRLGGDLSLADLQSFVINDCRAGRSVKVPEEPTSDETYLEIQAKHLPWIGETLRIEMVEGQDDSIRRLIYDRQEPEAGLQENP